MPHDRGTLRPGWSPDQSVVESVRDGLKNASLFLAYCREKSQTVTEPDSTSLNFGSSRHQRLEATLLIEKTAPLTLKYLARAATCFTLSFRLPASTSEMVESARPAPVATSFCVFWWVSIRFSARTSRRPKPLGLGGVRLRISRRKQTTPASIPCHRKFGWCLDRSDGQASRPRSYSSSVRNNPQRYVPDKTREYRSPGGQSSPVVADRPGCRRFLGRVFIKG